MSDTRTDVEEIRAALAGEFRDAVAEAQSRVAAVLDPACPTPAFLSALADELGKAAADPSSVPYPELVDPDKYWAASVLPQVHTARDHIAAILEWVESQVVQTMSVAESDLKQVVDQAVAAAGINPLADRADLEKQLNERCNELHHQMAELLDVLPDASGLDESKDAFSVALRARASADVDSLKAAYLAEAGGDETHQHFAEQQWSETYADRVGHREAMLAGVVPWRHQFLAITGYERSWSEAGEAVESLVARLQAPLRGLPGLLLERYDNAER